MVTIIDYGIGNLRSLEKAFQKVDVEVHRTDDPEAIANAERLVLPGVGAFGACIAEIRSRDLQTPIVDAVHAGTPLLGVCVGLQLLFEAGYEKGVHEGLSLLSGTVRHLHEASGSFPDDLVVPHMGWNELTVRRPHPLLDGLGEDPYVYFVHSYQAVPDEPEDILATASYGHAVPAVVQHDHVYGVQFHPEKSQATGLRLLQNFARLSLPVTTSA